MKRVLKAVAWIVGIIWAILVFAAGNSPIETQKAVAEWLSVLGGFGEVLTTVITSPVFVGCSILIVGLIIGWTAKGWAENSPKSSWAESLGVDMSLLSYSIQNSGLTSDVNRLNGEIDVVRIAAETHQIPFPKQSDGFQSMGSLTPYLGRVSALLQAGHIDQARAQAKYMCDNPPAENRDGRY